MTSSWRHGRAALAQRAAQVPPLPGTRSIAFAAALVAAALVAACGGNGDTEPEAEATQAARAQATAADVGADSVQTLAKTIPPAPVYDDWPAITSSIPKDPAIESRVAQIVASMTLEQKIGQMTQPEIKSITPDQVRQYFIGSVLNGGGSWPNGNKRAASSDWVALADQYYNASMSTTMATKVPIIWGTDAIHGHSNVYQATLFPHNIGLGAAHDPGLVKKIGASVGKAVRSTGINWVFAPTLAVAQDDRWGRTYESFSEDASIVRAYAGAYISGLQGTFAADTNVVATAKHFMGDGGTDQGTDQGVNMASKDVMINVHGQGYYTALESGAQTVMASFNSWTNPSQGINEGKMHGSKYMLTDVLKTKMLFDGFVVSDWNGIGQVPGCTNASCAQAINAGIDMVMVPDEWRAFISNTVAQVNSGAIPMSRINDAVTRILRVKMRAGMFNGRKPSQTPGAGDPQQLQARSLARQAVRKSLVLLKNNDAVLPLTRGKKTLVVGKSANSMANQTGGWSLTWQGTGNSNADFAGISDTILSAIQQAAGADKVDYSETGVGKNVADYDVVIAVIGETPYAEGAGDINASKTLAHSRNYPEDLAALNTVSGKGKPVVTLLLSGRPVYANDLINKSDAFVAAWLPGTEGRGVTDVIYRNAKGNVDFDFTGSLSFSWPKDACQTPLNKGDGQEPQFALGYGQKYAKPKTLAALPTPAIPNTCSGGGGGTLMIFNQVDYPPFALTVNAEANNWQNVKIGSDLNAIINVPASGDPAIRVQTTQVNTQQDAKQVTWFSHAQFFSKADNGQDLSIYTDGTLEFDWMVAQAPTSTVKLQMDCGYPCRGSLDITSLLRSAPLNAKQTIKVPLSCFASAGATLGSIDTPFSIESLGTLKLSLTQMKVVKGGALSPDALSCSQLGSFAVFGPNGPAPGFSVTSWQSANNFVSYQVMPAGAEPAEIRAQYANTSGANGMVYLAGGPVDLTPMRTGSFAVELYPYLYGSNTTDFTLKLESGPGCSTADITLGKPTQGAWTNVSVPMSTVLAGASGCFDLSKVNYVGVFPRWNQQAGVQMTMRNLRFLQ